MTIPEYEPKTENPLVAAALIEIHRAWHEGRVNFVTTTQLIDPNDMKLGTENAKTLMKNLCPTRLGRVYSDATADIDQTPYHALAITTDYTLLRPEDLGWKDYTKLRLFHMTGRLRFGQELVIPNGKPNSAMYRSAKKLSFNAQLKVLSEEIVGNNLVITCEKREPDYP